MEDKERQQAAYLSVLICGTIFITILIGESYLLGWEMSTPLLIFVGVVICWWVHLTKRLPQEVSLWINVVLTMITFFFYGSHEISIYDLAPVIIILMILYASTEMQNIVNLCMITYYVTILYDFIFVLHGFAGFDALKITRTLLHLGLVYMAGYIVKLEIKRKQKERGRTEQKISELEETNRRTEDFLTNVSHELRTPINVVTGITATMLRNEENATKRRDILSIQLAGQRLFNQVEDILDFTELDTGRIQLSEDTYMVASLVNDIVSGSQMFDRKDMPELIINLDAAMPAALYGDGRKIKKMLKHLIDNGMKFTKQGGVYVKIYTMPKPYGVNLCIQVTDTGIGISEDKLSKIQERFYQTNSGRNRKAGGLGLGLSIVYGLVAAMEGFIQVSSIVGQGTTVKISIPQKVADPASHMTVKNKEQLFLACFLEPEKYEIPEVRIFYNETITGLVRGLDLTLRMVSGIDELKQLVSKYQLTHLFIGKEEFLGYRDYFETMDADTQVVVVSDEELPLPRTGRYKLLKKPFYCQPVVNILNSGAMEDVHQSGYMRCPGVKVLVVDDEPMNLMVAEGVFKEYDMTVKTAKSGIEAIEICEQEAFDLIFLDHMMPEMDGIETLKRLRKLQLERDQLLTVVAFTANAVSGAREMFLSEGFDEFISKPIEDCELKRVLRKLLPKSAIVYTEDRKSHTIYEEPVKQASASYTGESVRETSTGHAGESAKQASADPAVKPEHPDTGEVSDPVLTDLENIGLNTGTGLLGCRGDVEFYKELLTQYAKDAEKKQAEMERLFAAKDWDNYRIQVHALKSTSKMVGQEQLSEMARAAEDAAKEHDEAYISAHHRRIMECYRELAQGIYSVLCENTDKAGDQNVETGEELPKEEWLAQLTELKQCFATFEADRAEALIRENKNRQYQGCPVEDLLSDVMQDIDDFEFEAATEKVDALIDRVKGGEL